MFNITTTGGETDTLSRHAQRSTIWAVAAFVAFRRTSRFELSRHAIQEQVAYLIECNCKWAYSAAPFIFEHQSRQDPSLEAQRSLSVAYSASPPRKFLEHLKPISRQAAFSSAPPLWLKLQAIELRGSGEGPGHSLKVTSSTCRPVSFGALGLDATAFALHSRSPWLVTSD